MTQSRRHEPAGGISIIFEDRDIIVINKPVGLLTIGTDREKTKTAHFLLNDYVRKGNSKSSNRVYVVHRLDRETSGILVFAKSEQAKRYLQDNWEKTEKHYLAILHGNLKEKEGTISSYLTENRALKVYSTNDPSKGRLSHTAYKVLEEQKGFTMVDVNLITGRKHQIRVHFAEMGHPVVGDKKYVPDEAVSKRLALHACSIMFNHPFTRKPMTFDTGIPDEFVRLFRRLQGITINDERGKKR
ncbi:MAG: RNA pseudouridine synthase [Deltaproteobacteria bacterium]|nr:RNA pseudouridine synthase [Deltaproteobacteria bacterium]